MLGLKTVIRPEREEEGNRLRIPARGLGMFHLTFPQLITMWYQTIQFHRRGGYCYSISQIGKLRFKIDPTATGGGLKLQPSTS